MAAGPQVKYLGLLENVKVRRAGFAYRQDFDRFLRRFRYLSPRCFPRPFPGPDREGCRAILDAVPQLQGVATAPSGPQDAMPRSVGVLFFAGSRCIW